MVDFRHAGTAWLNAQVHAAGGDETATFKVYDASTGVTYDTIDLSVVIKPEGEVGSFGEPLLIKVVGGETNRHDGAGDHADRGCEWLKLGVHTPKRVQHQMEGKPLQRAGQWM